jgi:TPR repeat protein
LGLAAVIAWVVVVSIPSVRSLLKTDVVRAGLQGTSVSTDLANAAKVARESGNLLEPSSRSDPSEVTAVAPITSIPVAPGHVLSSAPNRTSPEFVTRQLDRDELASMRQRADDFIKSGDLSSARLLLERGAEAGDARATLTLAGTFDPNVLKTLGFQEGVADIAMARFWYDRAQKLDAAEAPRRIQELATASVK